MNKNRQIKTILILLILLCATYENIDAKLMAEVHTATGEISNIKDNIITLKGGNIFYPGIQSDITDFHTGTTITIRYYIKSDGTYLYTQIAPGENSLSDTESNDNNTFIKKAMK